jgi:hypothetical protein
VRRRARCGPGGGHRSRRPDSPSDVFHRRRSRPNNRRIERDRRRGPPRHARGPARTVGDAALERVEERHAEAEYIDADGTSERATEALERTRRILNEYEATPENGLVVYAGVVDTETVDYVFDDLPSPVATAAYERSNEFDTDPLDVAAGEPTYGLLIVEHGEAMFGTLTGDDVEPTATLESDRREENPTSGPLGDREQGSREFFEQVAERAEIEFLGEATDEQRKSDADPGEPDADPVEGLFVGGSDVHPPEFLDDEYLDPGSGTGSSATRWPSATPPRRGWSGWPRRPETVSRRRNGGTSTTCSTSTSPYSRPTTRPSPGARRSTRRSNTKGSRRRSPPRRYRPGNSVASNGGRSNRGRVRGRPVGRRPERAVPGGGRRRSPAPLPDRLRRRPVRAFSRPAAGLAAKSGSRRSAVGSRRPARRPKHRGQGPGRGRPVSRTAAPGSPSTSSPYSATVSSRSRPFDCSIDQERWTWVVSRAADRLKRRRRRTGGGRSGAGEATTLDVDLGAPLAPTAGEPLLAPFSSSGNDGGHLCPSEAYQ